MTDERRLARLRKRLDRALENDDLVSALEVLALLQEADPRTPRWSHKRGDLLRKQNDVKEAIRCYATAVDLYADQGFIARAVAMARTILDLDPSRIDVLERVDPEAARKLHRRHRPRAISNPPGSFVGGDASPAMSAMRHPMVIDEAAPVPVAAPRMLRHSLVIEDAAPIAESGPLQLPMLIEDGSPPIVSPPPIDSAPPPERDSAPQAFGELSLPPAANGRASEPGGEAIAGAEPDGTQSLPAPPRLPRGYEVMLDQADELISAPDRKPHETRFSDAPKRRSVDIDITDLELQNRRSVTRDDMMRPDPPSAPKLSQLPLFPLFAEMPKELLQELVTRAQVISLDDGAYVVRTGEPANALYGIVEGSVQVVVVGQHLKVTLAEGDVFGEACLLPGERRHADVVVQGRLVALRVPRDVLQQMIREHPRLAEVMLELLTRRLLGNLLQSSPLFQEFDAAGRRELVKRIEIRRAPRGTLLAEVGKAMDGLYITLTGTVEVSNEDRSDRTQHGPGSMFGQHSLLGEDPSPVTVRAMNHIVVLRLPSAAFTELAMQYPAILAHVADLRDTGVANVTT
jgi:CRP-like cAMP-binding protein